MPGKQRRRGPSKRTSRREVGINTLYQVPLASERRGALYTAFPYPTKISPDAIALFLAAHTRPGDTVFDGFAGSGTTGLAAILCENPTKELRAKAKNLGLPVKWGPRNAVLYELGALGSFIARSLTSPPEPDLFTAAAQKILRHSQRKFGWMYEAADPSGEPGTIRHLIWSEELTCPRCKRHTSLWSTAVSRSPAQIKDTFKCTFCAFTASTHNIPRATETVHDALLETERTVRRRVPIWVYGRTGSSTWQRPINKSDLNLIARIEREKISSSVPIAPIPWGDLHRAGYHEGITHLHHFYTRRNLVVFADLWERTSAYEGKLQEALRFWLLSYNASHSTIMTRVVAKTGQNDLVVTSSQPGVLYVSGLPVEKNIYAGLSRKLKTISDAFSLTYGRNSRITVRQKSSTKLDLMNDSIDYAFIDPPFGGNIPYAEVNFVNEAWLGNLTDVRDEAIVSRHQHKSIEDYQRLLTNSFAELNRVLKPKAGATIVFHSATAEVWNALRGAYKDAGFTVERASVLDKTQSSFKQVTTAGSVKGDPVLLLSKHAALPAAHTLSTWQIAAKLHRQSLASSDPEERSPQRLYSRFVSHFLMRDETVPVDADAFYRWFRLRRDTQPNFDAYA